ncbi:MAG: DUF3015 family protein [Nitrospirota bacterium]
MKSVIVTALRLLPVLALAFTLPACTTKGTIKATTDPTTDILSSTSGKTWFTEDGLVKDEYKAEAFASLNYENLKQDMAIGRGEYLASLGTLLAVPQSRQPEFFALTQEKYQTLFRSDRTTPGEMLAALRSEVLSSPTLR